MEESLARSNGSDQQASRCSAVAEAGIFSSYDGKHFLQCLLADAMARRITPEQGHVGIKALALMVRIVEMEKRYAAMEPAARRGGGLTPLEPPSVQEAELESRRKAALRKLSDEDRALLGLPADMASSAAS